MLVVEGGELGGVSFWVEPDERSGDAGWRGREGW